MTPLVFLDVALAAINVYFYARDKKPINAAGAVLCGLGTLAVLLS